ncbi:MAG: hypothetical protein CMP41_04250 [Rickettsiales bacterium]|nr:hypothetical protein [Rickettsiales bacterium]
MSLRNGENKMSKSDPSDFSRINLTDSSDTILKKIQKAKTDSLPFPNNLDELETRSEVSNLINIFSSISGLSKENIIKDYENKNFSVFKNDLCEILIEEISKISIKIKQLKDDRNFLESVLSDGKKEAQKLAESNMKSIKDIIGFF